MSGLIVHEWMEQVGGAELVVKSMMEAYPDADLLTLWNSVEIDSEAEVRTTWLQNSPLKKSKSLALPLMVPTWRGAFEKSRYDWALVSSHAFAHHVSPKGGLGGLPKLVYCHTPARYIWAPEHEVRGQSLPIRAAAAALKPLDRRRAQEITSVVANSGFVADRVRNAWGLEAGVIYPPVDVTGIQATPNWADALTAEDQKVFSDLPSEFIMGASRLVGYKRLDQVIEVGEQLGLPVVVAGDGPDRARLEELAAQVSVPVHFLGRVTREMMLAAMQRASLFVFPPVEDFGIVPVEVMALGTPVLVNEVGGAKESLSVIGGGLSTDFSDLSRRKKDAEHVLSGGRSFDASKAAAFSDEAFKKNLTEWVAANV